MKKIFEDLLNQLQSLKVFNFIAIYNNQIDRLRLSLISFNFPACFIEIQISDVLTLQNGVSGFDLIFRFHIVDFQLDAGDGTLDQNLKVFQYRNLLRKTFVQYFPPNCGAMQANNDYQDYKHGNTYHYIQEFKSHYIDVSALKTFETLSGYIYWDQNQISWDETLLLWDKAYWGYPYLQIDQNVTLSPTASVAVYGNDIVTIYKSIFTQLNTIVDERSKPLWKNIYIFNDQIKRLIKSMGSYNYPSIFVEIKQNKESPLQNKLSRMDLIITFHILAEELDNGNAYSYNGRNLDQNTYVFKLRDLVNNAMVLFFPPQCSALIYNSEKMDYNHTNVYHYQLSYKTHYIDITAYQQLATMSATASISYQIVEEN